MPRTPSLRFVGLIAGLACAPACGSLLGIDTRSLEPESDASFAGDSPVETGPGTDGGPGRDGGAEDGNPGADGAPGPDGAPRPDGGPDAAPCNAAGCLFASALNLPQRITSDATRVYWTEYGSSNGSGDGSVKSCPLTGCAGSPLTYALGQVNPLAITVDSTRVYWTSASWLFSCPLGGCASGPTQVIALDGTAVGVAVDATYVYWVSQSDGAAHRALKAGGGTDETMATVGFPEGCTTDGVSLFSVDEVSSVVSVPLGGGSPVTISAMYTNESVAIWPIALDSTSVYFGSGNTINRVGKTGGTTLALIDTLNLPSGLAVDPATGFVYWTDFGSGNPNAADGTIGKVSLDGGVQSTLAASLSSPRALTVAGGSIYWVSLGTLDGSGDAMPNTGAIYQAPE